MKKAGKTGRIFEVVAEDLSEDFFYCLKYKTKILGFFVAISETTTKRPQLTR